MIVKDKLIPIEDISKMSQEEKDWLKSIGVEKGRHDEKTDKFIIRRIIRGKACLLLGRGTKKPTGKEYRRKYYSLITGKRKTNLPVILNLKSKIR